MNIPESVVKMAEKSTSPLDNRYFNHAFKALDALDTVKEETYCWDYVGVVISCLERIYRGFLKAASIHYEWYTLPSEKFLDAGHDILGMAKEKKAFS